MTNVLECQFLKKIFLYPYNQSVSLVEVTKHFICMIQQVPVFTCKLLFRKDPKAVELFSLM